MAELFIPLIFLVIVVVVGLASVANRKAQVEAWTSFARQSGLKLSGEKSWGNPRMEGMHQKIVVVLQIEVHGSGKQRKTFTRATARFDRAMPRGLNITTEGFTDRLAKLVGGQDIEIGHAELDRKLRIRAEDEQGARALMARWRARNAIAAFLARDPRATVTQHLCSILRPGFVSSHAELKGMLSQVTRAVIEVQRGLEEDGEAPPEQASPPPPPPEEPAPVTRFEWEPGTQGAETVAGLLEQHGLVVSTSEEVLEITEISVNGETEREVRHHRSGSPEALPDALVSFFETAATTVETSGAERAEGPIHVSPASEPDPSPPATGEGSLEALLALAERGLSAAELKSRTSLLVGRRLSLGLEVERVSLTMGMGVPPELEGGHTVVAKPAGEEGPRIALRFPATRSAEVSGLGYGDRLEAVAVFRSWDEFYRQATMDAQG
jgi:hypothetical protein